MRTLPDPDLSLRDASDFIFGSELCRAALKNPEPAVLGVVLRDIVAAIYKLTVSCHLPEFTDHGLHHLCSLVDRLSRWTTTSSSQGIHSVVGSLDPPDCAVLLLATLFHDIGMLSQRPEDLPREQPLWDSKGYRDIPNWVRTTHIQRIDRLVQRLFAKDYPAVVPNNPIFRRAISVAMAHGYWPWEWDQFSFTEKDKGLAAMLAVGDLLDEDSNRCDTATLLQHRLGNHLNCAHWIRHGLTSGRVLIDSGIIRVALRRPAGTDAQLEPVFSALRNHYRLTLLYLEQLAVIGANILRIDVIPSQGCPAEEAPELDSWFELPGFGTQAALRYHLLSSFMPQALMDSQRVSAKDIKRLKHHNLEEVDLEEFHRVRGSVELHSYEEQAFSALIL
jgi:hypothetical protein